MRKAAFSFFLNELRLKGGEKERKGVQEKYVRARKGVRSVAADEL